VTGTPRDPRGRRPAWLLAALLLAVLATGAALGAAAGVPTVAAAAESEPEPARITVLSRGSTPRVQLRNAFIAGTTAQGSIALTQSITTYAGGTEVSSIDVPPVHMAVVLEVGEVATDGSARVTGTYPSVEVTDDGTLSAADLQQLQSALDPLTAVTQTYRVTARNEVSDTEVSGTDDLEPAVGQIVSQLAGQAGGVALVYPREALGVGAKWRSVANVLLNGVDVRQTHVVTVRELSGTVAVFDLEITQVAPRQEAEFPGAPAGAKVEVTRWRLTGSGTTTIDLADPLPRAAESRIGGTQRLRITQGGEGGSTRTDLETETVLTR